ncbi:hypothetical protein [Thiolapillus sp.]
MDASLYNLWRRARLHLRLPLRFQVPESPGVAMIVEEEQWVCVNTWQQDLPISAWHEFDHAHRQAPVRRCNA